MIAALFANPLPDATEEARAVGLAVAYLPMGWGALDVIYRVGCTVGWSPVLDRSGWILIRWLELAERRHGGQL